MALRKHGKNGKDDEHLLFYAVCYAVRYMQTKKTEKCSDIELEKYLQNEMYSSLKTNQDKEESFLRS